MTEYEQQITEDFEKARKDLRESTKDGKQFHKYETLYGEAYSKLVTAGLKPKLRVDMRPLY
jgi:hypothetical protein